MGTKEKDDRPWKIPRPKGMAEHILRECQSQPYLIFSKKLNMGTCTRCGEEFSLDGMLMYHSADARITVTCPSCRCAAVPKDIRYGRKKLLDKGRLTWMRAYGPVTFIEVDRFVIDYTMPHPAVFIEPHEMIRLSADSQIRMDREDGYWSGVPSWYKVKTIKLKQKPHRIFGTSDWVDHLWWEHVELGTDLRYADEDPLRFDDSDYEDEERMIGKFIRYLSDFLRYPAIELLEKSGFERIVMDRAAGKRTKNMNIQGKNLRSILKMDNGDIKKMRRMDVSMGFVDDVNKVREYLPGAGIEDVSDLKRILGWARGGERWKAVEPRVNFRKLVYRLLEEVQETGDRITLVEYCDYIEAVDFLGIRVDKRVLYPKNFMEAHDEAVGAANEIKEREKNAERARLLESFGATNRRVTGMDEPFIRGGFLIRPAGSPAELRKESKALSHCVRTYTDRVAKGHTSILFIRKEEEPDTPLFTLEMAPDGRVIQCRGDHNCGYPEEVGRFIEEWKNWRTKMLKSRATA